MAKPVVLVIRDGWGINPGGKAEREKNGDATLLARTPFHDQLYRDYPHSTLSASGVDVGLPEGQMGNSEVGHLNLGAGRIVYQDLTRINKAVAEGELSRNEVLQAAFRAARNGRLHFIGLVSDGGVHSHYKHLVALAAAAKDLLAVRDVVHAEPGRQVGTVGYMKAEPGAPNVIPGRVEFPVELRDLDSATIERMWDHIQERFAQTDKEEGVETRCAVINDTAPAISDPSVQSVIREAAHSAGLSTADLPSGAVHDAGEISRLAPMGMIFVPSRDGISHAPQEFSTWDDVANGTEVLYRSVLSLDKQMNAR